MRKSRLLLVANDIHHEFGHRINELKRYIDQRFDLYTISLVPPGFGRNTTHGFDTPLLRGWPNQVLLRGKPLIWRQKNIVLIRRAPLPSLLGPFVNLLMIKRVLRSVNPDDFDVILVQGPVPGKAVSDTNLPFLYDHADNYWGGRVDSLHRRILGTWQDSVIRRATAVSCAGMSLQTHARRLKATRSELFPNGVHLSDYNKPHVETSDPSIVYVGGLEQDCGLINALRALEFIPRRIHLIIAGSGPYERHLRRRTKSLRTDSVIDWLGSVSRSEVADLLSSSWIGLALFTDSLWNRHAFHLKIVEYMAAGLPFLTTPVGDAGKLAHSAGAGIVVSDDPQDIARSLVSLLDDTPKRGDMGNRGRDAARSYEWSDIGVSYTEWLAGFSS